MKTLSSEQIKGRVSRENFYIVDIGSEFNYDQAHLKGSVNVPLDVSNFSKKVEKKVGNKTAGVLLCGGNVPVAKFNKMANTLEKEGFSNVYTCPDTVDEWKRTGLNIECK